MTKSRRFVKTVEVPFLRVSKVIRLMVQIDIPVCWRVRTIFGPSNKRIKFKMLSAV